MLTILLPYTLTCLIIELTPGPNMAYLAILAAGSGKRAGFAAVVGIALGLALLGGIAALGMAEIIRASPVLARGLTLAGFFYLLWLAYDSWRGENETSASRAGFVEQRMKYFRRGAITNLLNPKALLFYVTLLPGFVGNYPNPLVMTALLTGISVAVATTIHVVIVLLASRFQPFLTNPKRQRRTRRVMALMLAGVALWFGAKAV